MKPVLTAKVGTNADLFPDILRLYVPEGSHVLDMTYGRGVFWKNVDISKYDLVKNDIDPTVDCNMHHDCRNMEILTCSFDAVVLDLPYLYVGGFKTLRPAFISGAAGSYGNRERALEIHGVEAVDKLYFDSMKEAHRILKRKGILILKCMDQVASNKQVWAHVTYLGYGDYLGFKSEDLFVLVRNSQPLMRHKPDQQKHARRNHSYFLVLRKRR